MRKPRYHNHSIQAGRQARSQASRQQQHASPISSTSTLLLAAQAPEAAWKPAGSKHQLSMPALTQRNGTAGDGDSLILTPSKLRLHSWVFGPYITCLWLPNAILAYLLLLKASYVLAAGAGHAGVEEDAAWLVLAGIGAKTPFSAAACCCADWVCSTHPVVACVPATMDRPCWPCRAGGVCAGIRGEQTAAGQGGGGCAGWHRSMMCVPVVCASWTWPSSCALLHFAVALHTPLTRQTVVLLPLQDKLVRQQLGPAPPATASPGMILQYNTMFSERKRALFIDNVNGLIEGAAALLVKVRADAGLAPRSVHEASSSTPLQHAQHWDGHAGSWMVPGVLQALSTQPGLQSDHAQTCAVAEVLRAPQPPLCCQQPSATCVLPCCCRWPCATR